MRKFLVLMVLVCCGCEDQNGIDPERPNGIVDDSGIYLNPSKGLRFGVELAPGFYLDQSGQISPGFEL